MLSDPFAPKSPLVSTTILTFGGLFRPFFDHYNYGLGGFLSQVRSEPGLLWHHMYALLTGKPKLVAGPPAA